MGNAPTKEEAENVIHKFYHLMYERAHLVDFFEILDEGFEIRFKDIVFKGYRGFEDHQEGKRWLFDEEHNLKEVHVSFQGPVAIVKSQGIWSARYRKEPEPRSHHFKATISHTWRIGRSPKTGHIVILSQLVDSLNIFEGEIPPYLKK